MATPAASLIDPSPAIQVAVIGATLALIPLAVLAWRRRAAARTGQPSQGSWLKALTLTTLFLTFDLIVFGSFTRLTDAGLGCPDWPGCYGSATPWGARSHIDAAVAHLPDGPVTHGKAWIEMIHRYLATLVGALISVMTVVAWRGRALAARSPWWATATLGWVIAQGAFGALTVTLRLYPAVVTLHLLLGMGLLALLAVQAALDRTYLGHTPWGQTQSQPRPTPTQGLLVLAWLGAVALVVQLALGAWVSTNYAVLACQDFPTCQGQWWPPMDFAHGFTLNRALGRTGGDEAFIPFAALTAIHLVHRFFAGVLTLVALGLAWQLRQNGLARWALGLLGLLTWQLLSGISNVVLAWPMVAALMHVAGAALWVAWFASLLTHLQQGLRKMPTSGLQP